MAISTFKRQHIHTDHSTKTAQNLLPSTYSHSHTHSCRPIPLELSPALYCSASFTRGSLLPVSPRPCHAPMGRRSVPPVVLLPLLMVLVLCSGVFNLSCAVRIHNLTVYSDTACSTQWKTGNATWPAFNSLRHSQVLGTQFVHHLRARVWALSPLL